MDLGVAAEQLHGMMFRSMAVAAAMGLAVLDAGAQCVEDSACYEVKYKVVVELRDGRELLGSWWRCTPDTLVLAAWPSERRATLSALMPVRPVALKEVRTVRVVRRGGTWRGTSLGAAIGGGIGLFAGMLSSGGGSGGGVEPDQGAVLVVGMAGGLVLGAGLGTVFGATTGRERIDMERPDGAARLGEWNERAVVRSVPSTVVHDDEQGFP